MASQTSTKTLSLYKGLLRTLRFYPSTKKQSIIKAVKDEFRENRNLEGDPLERKLWLAQMELERLQTWVPTGKQMMDGVDMDIKL